VAEPGRTLVGFDFAFGYPIEAGLPVGRALCARFAGMIRDEPDGANNRFEVAGLLNREIQGARAEAHDGPFWGHPGGRGYPHLAPKRPRPFPPHIPNGRMAERRHGARGIQSPWKLYTVGAVGSQTLVGLPAVHRLLVDPALAGRTRLWPFETAWDRAIDRDSIVIAEMWPSLVDCRGQHYRIKDARQVAALRDWALDEPAALARGLARPAGLTDAEERVARESEGWIVEPSVSAGERGR